MSNSIAEVAATKASILYAVLTRCKCITAGAKLSTIPGASCLRVARSTFNALHTSAALLKSGCRLASVSEAVLVAVAVLVVVEVFVVLPSAELAALLLLAFVVVLGFREGASLELVVSLAAPTPSGGATVLGGAA